MATVTIKKVQAVDFVQFDMPEGQGGVRLLRGENGAGKTTALACLNALLGKKVSLVPSDDAPKGMIEGLGRSITVQKRVTAKGDVDVRNLEGRFDFSDLVEPPIKDPIARNKARIRSLVGLTAGDASIEDFYDLFGGKESFEANLGSHALPESGDVLELADAVKEATQAVARDVEARLESESARWQVAITDSKGHKATDQPPTVAKLADEYSAAQRARLQASEAINAAARAQEHNARVQSKLAAHSDAKPAVAMDKANETVNKCRAMVQDLEAKLAVAKTTLEEAKRRFDAAHQWEERQAELEESLMKVPESLPDIGPLEAAEIEALESLQSAEETKTKYDAAVRAKELGASIIARKGQAEKLRDVAKRTNEVVTSKLPAGCPLQVKDNVLCAYHDGRGAWVQFDELSEGERWRASLHIAINAVGVGGVVPVRQEAWQSLDSDAQQWVARQCEEAKVWVVSGAVSDGPLRVEEFNPEA